MAGLVRGGGLLLRPCLVGSRGLLGSGRRFPGSGCGLGRGARAWLAVRQVRGHQIAQFGQAVRLAQHRHAAGGERVVAMLGRRPGERDHRHRRALLVAQFGGQRQAAAVGQPHVQQDQVNVTPGEYRARLRHGACHGHVRVPQVLLVGPGQDRGHQRLNEVIVFHEQNLRARHWPPPPLVHF